MNVVKEQNTYQFSFLFEIMWKRQWHCKRKHAGDNQNKQITKIKFEK